jgi:hypothetical protein
VTEDSAVFVIQGEAVQVFKFNQKVFEMKAYKMMAITTSKSVVAIGTLVCISNSHTFAEIYSLFVAGWGSSVRLGWRSLEGGCNAERHQT